jgi:hypothetical protein
MEELGCTLHLHNSDRKMENIVHICFDLNLTSDMSVLSSSLIRYQLKLRLGVGDQAFAYLDSAISISIRLERVRHYLLLLAFICKSYGDNEQQQRLRAIALI